MLILFLIHRGKELLEWHRISSSIFIPQAFNYWLKHQLYIDNQWLIFSHKALHLSTHVDSCLEQPVLGEKARDRKLTEIFKGESCVWFVIPFFSAQKEIRSNSITGYTWQHVQDTYWIYAKVHYFAISSSDPFSQLLKCGSWLKTLPCYYYVFFFSLESFVCNKSFNF